MATNDLPDPVGVDKMTFAPETISMSASSWCGYNVSPRRFDHPAKASKTASGSDVSGRRSMRVTADQPKIKIIYAERAVVRPRRLLLASHSEPDAAPKAPVR